MTKRVVASLLVTLAIAAGTVAAQSVPQDPPKSADITVTGCLIQGSGPTVFLLDNAKVNPSDTNEKGVRYLVINMMEDVNLVANLDHELTIVGTPAYKLDSTIGKTDESKLPTLTTKSVVVAADRCTGR